MLRSALDFAVAIQFVRQVEQMQRGTFEGAQMQITGFGSFGLQHRQEFNVLPGLGGQHHFADGAVVGSRIVQQLHETRDLNVLAETVATLKAATKR